MTKPADSDQIAKARRFREQIRDNHVVRIVGTGLATRAEYDEPAIMAAFHESELDLIQRKVACSFCGTITEYDHKKEHAQADAILAHIETCEKSPVKQLLGALAEIDRLKSERQAVKEECCRAVCQGCADEVSVQEKDSVTTANGNPFWHYIEKFDYWAICDAAAIRSME